MRILRFLGCVFWFPLILAACDDPPTTPIQTRPEVGVIPSEPPADETPAPTDDGDWPAEFFDTDDSPLTPEEIVGMWSIAPNCAQPRVFMADGTYTDHTGYTGRWTLNNEMLSLVGQRDTYVNEVNQIDANTFTAGAPRGTSRPGVIHTFIIYRRC